MILCVLLAGRVDWKNLWDADGFNKGRNKKGTRTREQENNG
jgi:hypothetical protein